MKKTLVITTVLLVFGFASALIVRFAGRIALNAPDLFAAIGSIAACGIVIVAFSDYARKPRFGFRRARRAKSHTATPATPSAAETAPAWTYSTISA